MLIAGGIAFIVIELYIKQRKPSVEEAGDVTCAQAFLIGLAQSLSMIPGVSRSGATIMGGLLCGLNRKVATEFSFMLALPTMLAATFYDIYNNHALFQMNDIQNIVVGFITSFIFAVISIKALLRFVTGNTFISFGIYRIAVGVLFLVFLP